MSTKGQIESSKIVINDLFTRFWFRIPSYQRSYVWGKDEITDLIDDINYACKQNSENQYFLGSMVLCKTENKEFLEYEVVDGQQRLTTLMLMLACIRDHTNSNTLKQSCQGKICQAGNVWDKTPSRNRVLYDIRDNVEKIIDIYIKIENGTKNEELDGILKEPNQSRSNMVRGMNIIHSVFKDKTRFYTEQDFTNFVSFLFNNVLFIYVATDDADDAFRLFTILSNRGIPLSNSDILKAKNLGVILDAKTQEKWATYWEQIETDMGRDEFDRFLSLVRTIYVKDKAREGLLKEFEDRIYGANNGANKPLLNRGINTFESIAKYKKAYDEAILLDLPTTSSLGDEYRNHINIMRYGFPSTEWIPPILEWYDKFGESEITTFIKCIENKFSADWILKLTPTERIGNMNSILRAIEKTSKKSLNDLLSDKKLFSYDKKELLSNFSAPIYGEKFAKYILLRLNCKLAGQAAFTIPTKISIEHILPQNPKPDSSWCKDFTDAQRIEWTHSLGNLILLSRNKNSSLSNSDFQNKKERYFTKNVETLPSSVSFLVESQEFKLEDLKRRHGNLLMELDCSY